MNLELSNCRIRSWRPDDGASIQRYANNRRIWINVRDIFPHPYTSENARFFLDLMANEQPPATFAIATDSEAIGCIGLRLGADVHRRTAELGYWLGEPFWGRGIMTEAVRAFTAWAFPRFDLVRIYAEPFANNAASIRLLEKASFTCEGRLRAHVCKDGQILDAFLYAKLREDELVKVPSEPKL
jgi:[ribosomal protein S5]-alanine N-acetyltransferase